MRGRSFAVTVMAGLAVAGCNSKSDRMTDSDRVAAIQDLTKTVLTQRGVPGLAIAVIRQGKPFQIVTAGLANVGTREQVTSRTPFQLASTTKIFASTAVLRLVADGKLRLDDPIGDHLEGIPPAWRAITIRQLLSYTSGLPDVATGAEAELVAQDWPAALTIVESQPFQFQPGTAWRYTQTNYALLLRMIEQMSGMSFEAFLNDRIFQPLGMKDTFFPNAQRQCAINYERAGNGQIVVRDLRFPHYVHAAGGLCSSIDDLLAWDTALRAGKVIPLPLLREAWRPARLRDGGLARVSGQIAYGLGWAIGTTPGHGWVGHSGGNSTVFRRYVDDDLTIVVLHNGASDPDAIAEAIGQAMTQTKVGGDAQSRLWDAASDGDEAALTAAIKAGANVNKLDTRSSKNGRYPLNWAAAKDHPAIIRLLLANRAKLDAQNMTGFTALHHAAEMGSAEAARALLEAGANPSLRNANGETPAAVARRKGHDDVAALIEAAAKRPAPPDRPR